MADTIPTNDIYMAAFLHFRGINPKLELNKGGRNVTFIFPATQTVLGAMGDYGTNPNIPLSDFISSLKIIRARMLATRSGT